MHILCILRHTSSGSLRADLFRELASYFGCPDAALRLEDETYFIHFIHGTPSLDDKTYHEAVDLVKEQLQVRQSARLVQTA